MKGTARATQTIFFFYIPSSYLTKEAIPDEMIEALHVQRKSFAALDMLQQVSSCKYIL